MTREWLRTAKDHVFSDGQQYIEGVKKVLGLRYSFEDSFGEILSDSRIKIIHWGYHYVHDEGYGIYDFECRILIELTDGTWGLIDDILDLHPVQESLNWKRDVKLYPCLREAVEGMSDYCYEVYMNTTVPTPIAWSHLNYPLLVQRNSTLHSTTKAFLGLVLLNKIPLPVELIEEICGYFAPL